MIHKQERTSQSTTGQRTENIDTPMAMNLTAITRVQQNAPNLVCAFFIQHKVCFLYGFTNSHLYHKRQ